MRRPNPAQLDVARRLVALEAGNATSADEHAAAAGRIHEKLSARLGSLVGEAGARALFARSVKITSLEFPCLANVQFDETAADGESLVRCLRGEPPAVVTEATVALCASLLALLATLIGERLTANVLRSAWPTFDSTHVENKR